MEEIRNEASCFSVRVDVDQADRVYEGGQLLKVDVVSSRAGYLYLLYKQAEGATVCLFPNKFQPDNRIDAKTRLIVPAPGAMFRLRVQPPFGQEVLIALVSLEKLPPRTFGVNSLTQSNVTPVVLPSRGGKGIAVEPANWAEHQVLIQTVPAGRAVASRNRRFGLFIGISKYSAAGIDLQVCHRDAIVMARVMEKQGRLDGGVVLTDEHATLANIRRAFENLVSQTRPGDEVFIYWSGHGAQAADTNGDEEDGFDEYLIPHDARVGEFDTLLSDDTFGRWIQDLDGRRVVVILDTCHSGGQSAAMKGFADTGRYFDFIDNELARAKDIGQRDAAMLCSSNSEEISAERREGDLSVMTYYLLELLGDNDSRPVTLRDAHAYVKDRVPEYIRKHFPGKEQTPILVNEIGDMYLRP